MLTEAEAADMVEQYRQGLDDGQPQARASLGMIGNKYTVDWSKYAGSDWAERVRGGGDLERLKALGERAVRFPRTSRCIRAWRRSWRTARRCSRARCRWTGAAPRRSPMPACSKKASRSASPARTRGRGTFFHRHAVLHDQKKRRDLHPAAAHRGAPAAFQVIDSVLSEEAVMGFEYGYSTTEPARW